MRKKLNYFFTFIKVLWKDRKWIWEGVKYAVHLSPFFISSQKITITKEGRDIMKQTEIPQEVKKALFEKHLLNKNL